MLKYLSVCAALLGCGAQLTEPEYHEIKGSFSGAEVECPPDLGPVDGGCQPSPFLEPFVTLEDGPTAQGWACSATYEDFTIKRRMPPLTVWVLCE